MFFESSKPVSGTEFFNRKKELGELHRAAEILKSGSTHYLALVGQRKVGKTSLLRQLMVELNDPDIITVHLDCWEKRLTPQLLFLEYLVLTIDGFVQRRRPDRFPHSIRASLGQEDRLLLVLADLRQFGVQGLEKAAELLLQLRRPGSAVSHTFESVIDLPEQLAQETQTYFMVMIDEFQEIESLNRFKAVRESLGDVFDFLRGRWQRHTRVNYIVAGSKLTMMKELLTDERRPFFQHFKIVEVGPFPEEEAKRLVSELSTRAGRPIPRALVDQLVGLVGTNPFYLQVLGSELCAHELIDQDTFKVVVQETLFNGSGRLSLYFQNLVGRMVGASASLEQTLITLAAEPGTLTQIARRMGVGTGTLKSWINRVADLVSVEDGIYRIADPALRLWLAGRSDLAPMLPPLVLGDEAEKDVARRLAAVGFELVYQSRGSRGAFDLLAILQTREVGVQVKKAALPFYLSRDEFQRMKHWAQQLGWVPLLALWADGTVRFYDVRRLQINEESVRIDDQTPAIENLLELV